jgi:uncharacterized protein (TIGR02217 family)
MSLPIYPSIQPGSLGVRSPGWPVKRSPEWSNATHTAASGKEFRLAYWDNPRWHFVIDYNYLYDNPQDIYQQNSDTDLRTIEGFYLSQQGSFSPFLFWDPSDNTVQGQLIGTGDGHTTQFQMVRTYSGPSPWITQGFTERIQAPTANPTINVYLNGAPQAGGYTIGSTGILTFTIAPGNGVVITADFSFFFTCRFEKDTIEFENFMYRLWTMKQVELISLKL